MENTPVLYIFAGPNGSGKSTITRIFQGNIPNIYINADEIKKKNNLSDQEAFVKANQLRQSCLKNKIRFSTETVFSHPSKLDFMREAKKLGYTINLVFVTTFNAQINVSRVADRVFKGGHDVPIDKIIARHERSNNLMPAAISLSDSARIYNNTLEEPVLILKKYEQNLQIYPQPYPSKWTKEKLLKIINEIEQFLKKEKMLERKPQIKESTLSKLEQAKQKAEMVNQSRRKNEKPDLER